MLNNIHWLRMALMGTVLMTFSPLVCSADDEADASDAAVAQDADPSADAVPADDAAPAEDAAPMPKKHEGRGRGARVEYCETVTIDESQPNYQEIKKAVTDKIASLGVAGKGGEWLVCHSEKKGGKGGGHGKHGGHHGGHGGHHGHHQQDADE